MNDAHGFTIVQLHRRNERGWAVVNRKTGAIVTNPDGSLLMRMSEAEARSIADHLTLTELETRKR